MVAPVAAANQIKLTRPPSLAHEAVIGAVRMFPDSETVQATALGALAVFAVNGTAATTTAYS